MVSGTEPSKLDFGSEDTDAKARMCELMLYVAQKCADDPTFGMTKLNKLLFFSDFQSYLRYGKAITGVPYIKLQFGPVPKLMLEVKRTLKPCDAEEVEMAYGGKVQKRLIAKRLPDLAKFSARDIALVDEMIDLFRRLNATQISKLSHDVVWETAKLKDEIPYQAVFLSNRLPSIDDFEWAFNLSKEHGWHN